MQEPRVIICKRDLTNSSQPNFLFRNLIAANKRCILCKRSFLHIFFFSFFSEIGSLSVKRHSFRVTKRLWKFTLNQIYKLFPFYKRSLFAQIYFECYSSKGNQYFDEICGIISEILTFGAFRFWYILILVHFNFEEFWLKNRISRIQIEKKPEKRPQPREQ